MMVGGGKGGGIIRNTQIGNTLPDVAKSQRKRNTNEPVKKLRDWVCLEGNPARNWGEPRGCPHYDGRG